MKVSYEQMEAFRGQLKAKNAEFEAQSNKMLQELDTLRTEWADSEGAVAFGSVIDEVKNQITQVRDNVTNTEQGLGKASLSYQEHDTNVKGAFTSMLT